MMMRFIRESEKLDSGEHSVFLEAYATLELAEEMLKKQVCEKIEEAKENEYPMVRIIDSGDDYAELVDEEGNYWEFSIEQLPIKGIQKD